MFILVYSNPLNRESNITFNANQISTFGSNHMLYFSPKNISSFYRQSNERVIHERSHLISVSSYSNQRQGHTDDTRQRECNKRQTDGDAILLCITSSPPHTHTHTHLWEDP